MIDSYWELYVAYVNKCVRDNWINDIDPHHYRMEWNHFLPKCIFGDWPIGHYLTLKQHAIASALQTLALKQNCMCGWHKEYLTDTLLELAWPFYRSSSQKVISKTHSERDERGKSIMASRGGTVSAKRLREVKNDNGESLLDIKMKELREISHREKDEFGRSVLGVKNSQRLHSEKDEKGRSIVAMKAILKINEIKYAERDEYGRSLVGKQTNFAKQARPIRVTNLKTGETFYFANSVDAGLTLGLGPRSLRRVAAGERKKHKGFTAEFTNSEGTYT